MNCRCVVLRLYFDRFRYYSNFIYINNKKLIFLYGITFIIVLPWILHDVPNSLYFTHFGKSIENAQADIRRENDRRLLETDQFISDYSPSHNFPTRQLDVIITVVSVSRNRNSLDTYHPRYLTQTAVALIRGLRQSGYNASLMLCNVDNDPDTYHEAIEMRPYFTKVFSRFSSARYTGDLHRLEKEKQDYAYCMLKSLEAAPRVNNVLLLEDDALPHRDMFPLLEYTISQRLSTQEDQRRTAYVKFFHPQWLIGYWSLDANRLASLWAASILLGFVSFLVESRISVDHCGSDKSPVLVSNDYSTVRLSLWCLYYCCVLIAIGRCNFVEWRRLLGLRFGYSYVPAPSCCTPAMLFPRLSAGDVLAALNATMCKKEFTAETRVSPKTPSSTIS